MKFRINYIFFILLSIFFYSCNFESDLVIKEDNSIIFYKNKSNTKYKEIKLDPAGHIISIQTFIDDRVDSEWIPTHTGLSDFKEYYGNGQIKVSGYIKDGHKHSLWSYFDRDGHLLIERYFSYGQPSNIWIWYGHADHHGHHENHNTDGSISHYEIYTDIRDDGLFSRYYQSSNMKEQKYYIDNQLDGAYSLFYDNPSNSIYLSGQYIAGNKIGDWMMFDKNGSFQKIFE